MTTIKIIQAIKAEIERLKDEYTDIAIDSHYGTVNANYVVADLERLLSFLSTLESEKPNGLEEEIDKYREEHLFDMPAFQQVARHFAQFGAEHTREQMMKNAVEGEVYLYHSYNREAAAIIVDIPKDKLGDKVKIIIVKEDEK